MMKSSTYRKLQLLLECWHVRLGAMAGMRGNEKIYSAILKYYSMIITWPKCSIKRIQSKIISWRLKKGFPERGDI